MKRAWTIARNEFRGYFDQPTAYILLVAFLGLALFLTFRNLYTMGAATLRPLFSLLPWLFAVFVPAIAMRSLAEERRSGTLEWLAAQPVTEVDLLVGKFLGNWLFVLVALAGTLPLAVGVAAVSSADAGIMVAQYVGAALLAAAMVAIGLFASSATTNQITAFILGAGMSFALVLAGLQVVTIGLPPALGAAVAHLSLMAHFQGIDRGVLDLRDIVYFVTATALFLVLAYLLLARQRLSHGRGAYRRLRVGVTALAAGIVLVNLLGSHIHGRLDLTRDRLFTLSGGTEDVLHGLDDVVTIKLYRSSELPPEVQLTLRDVRDLLADYRQKADGRVQVEEVDPDEDEDAAAEARSVGVSQIDFNVVRGDEFQVKRGWFGLAVFYADRQDAIPVISRSDDLEYRLTSMIAALVHPKKPRLAVVTGYGAHSVFSYPELQQALSQRYELKTVNLQSDSAPVLDPDSADVVVVAGPTQPFDPAAVRALDAYLNDGGAAMLLLDGTRVDMQQGRALPLVTGLDTLLEERGLRLDHTLVADYRSNESVSMGRQGAFNVISAYPLWPVVVPAQGALLTSGLESMTLGWASPLEITDSTRVTPLWTTTRFGGSYSPGMPLMPNMMPDPQPASLGVEVVAAQVAPPEADGGTEPIQGTAGIGAAGGRQGAAQNGQGAREDTAAAASAGGRLVVVGDADFLDRNFVQGNPQNLAFAANAVDWLAQDASLIAIRSKDRTPPPLVFESDATRNVLKWGNLIGVPLLFVLLGLYRVGTRTRRSQRAWEEV